MNPGTDTIYVPNFISNNMSVINGQTNTVVDTVVVPSIPNQVISNPFDAAVNTFSGTVYVDAYAFGTVTVFAP